MRKKQIVGTHTVPDLDAITAIWLAALHGLIKLKEAVLLFLKGGDEEFLNAMGITLIDRGRGEFDHHRQLKSIETSASLVAEKLGVAEDKSIQKLLRKVRRSDLQGESLPFDISDLIKCAQRNKDLTDEERINLGLKMLAATMEFERKELQRDHQWTQRIIDDFLKSKEEKPAVFNEYRESLNNPQFERPFDLVEILVGGRASEGEEATLKFVNQLLQLKYKDFHESFQRALLEVDKAWKIWVNGHLIVADVSDEPAFNRAARFREATVIVQQNTDGHTQWYFDTNKVDDILTDSIASMVRLEECLIQGREIPSVDLRQSGRIEDIPEWYYYKAPQIGKKKPGRFIQNGSLTAPDVPVTKIPLEILRDIAVAAVRYHPRFNWVRWMSERLAYHSKK